MDPRTEEKCLDIVDSLFLQDISLKKVVVSSAEEMNVGKEKCGMEVLPSEAGYLENQVGLDSEISSEEEVCPATPSPDTDSFDLSSTSDQNVDDFVIGCQTPEECIFDPFAPGPEELVCAPKKKIPVGNRVPLRRRLRFDSDSDTSEMLNFDIYAFGDVAEDDLLLQYLCESFFDLVVSNHMDEISSKLSGLPQDSESPRTPENIILLSGVAETCPPTPPRPTARSRVFCKGACRKLEFGTKLA